MSLLRRPRELHLGNLVDLRNLKIRLTNLPPTLLSTRTTLLPELIRRRTVDATGGVGARVEEELESMRFREGSEMEKFGTEKARRRGRVEVEGRARVDHLRGGRVERVLRRKRGDETRRTRIWEEWIVEEIKISGNLIRNPFDRGSKMENKRRRKRRRRM
jgi:hypothetical protein